MTETARQTTQDLGPMLAALRPALWRYLRLLGADAATAEDLVQDAFVVVLRRPDFDATSQGAVFSFLRTTCRQLWLRSSRRTTSEREVDESDALWNERCGDGLGEDYVDALRACLERLPARSRNLLAATYGGGLGREAAGARFGLGPDGVKSALRRLRAFLHDCINKRMESKR